MTQSSLSVLTHEGSKMQGSLLSLVQGLDISSLQLEEGEHFQVATVSSMVQGCLPRVITNVQVTQPQDQCLCRMGRGGRIGMGWWNRNRRCGEIGIG